MSTRMPSRRLTRRHAFVIGVLLINLVLVAHLCVAAWTGGAAHRGVDAALAETFSAAADNAAFQVGEYVDASEQTTDTMVRWIARDSPSVEEVGDRLLMLAAADSRLRVIVVAFPDDSFIAVVSGSSARGYPYVVATADASSQTYRMQGYSMDLEVRATEQYPWTVGARGLGFWDAAAPAYELVWTRPARRPLTGVGGAWAAQRVLGDDGEVRAVVATDFPLDSLQADLNALPLGEDGEIFLLDDARRVLAGPEDVSGVIATGFGADGGMPATELGLDPSQRATPVNVVVRTGSDGDLHTAERGLNDQGVPWVLHLRATDESLAPGILHLATVFRWITFGMLLVLVLATVVYAIVWRPLRDLRRAAYEDGLTGVSTRRRFVQLVPQTIADAHRDGGHVCVVVLDVDNFKSINDTRGHKAGDAALTVIGHVLSNHVRGEDLVARWGGDEFVAVLVMPPGKEGRAAMERLRQATEEALVETFPDIPGLGVTAGGTMSFDPADRIEDLVRDADDALVAGKRHEKSRSYAAID